MHLETGLPAGLGERLDEIVAIDIIAEDILLAVPAAQLLANDTDADGDNLTIAFVGSPVGGSVSLTAGQLVIFEPEENFQGQASFQYIVTDGFALATGNVTVNIRPMSQWSNPNNAHDVNNDGVVSAGDVLEVINVINAFGAAPLPSLFSTLRFSR